MVNFTENYATFCNEAYQNGITDELELNFPIENPVAQQLKLRPIGLLIAKTIQQTPSNKLLRVLFDTALLSLNQRYQNILLARKYPKCRYKQCMARPKHLVK